MTAEQKFWPWHDSVCEGIKDGAGVILPVQASRESTAAEAQEGDCGSFLFWLNLIASHTDSEILLAV